MRVLIVLAFLALSACGAPEHPLTYVSTSDPVWQITPPDDGAPPVQAAR